MSLSSQSKLKSNFQDSFQLIKHRKPSFIALYAVLVIISLITVTISLVHLLSRATIIPFCENPAIRREWRSLTRSEKQDFTQAAICLASIPSTWQPNGTIYDDFAILHGGIGSWCAFEYIYFQEIQLIDRNRPPLCMLSTLASIYTRRV